MNVTLIDDDVLEAEESKILNLFFEDESPFVMIGQDSEASVVITDDEGECVCVWGGGVCVCVGGE